MTFASTTRALTKSDELASAFDAMLAELAAARDRERHEQSELARVARMGLSICRSIIESYGGRLWGFRGEFCGSSFFINLPTVEVPGAGPSAPKASNHRAN